MTTMERPYAGVSDGEDRDNALVAEGRQLVKDMSRTQLRLGRLALAYAPVGDASVKSAMYERLQTYAEAIGMEVGTLRNYRAAASSWDGVPLGEDEFPFSIIKSLAPCPDKLAVLAMLRGREHWTVREAVSEAMESGLYGAGKPNATTTPSGEVREGPRPSNKVESARPPWRGTIPALSPAVARMNGIAGELSAYSLKLSNPDDVEALHDALNRIEMETERLRGEVVES